MLRRARLSLFLLSCCAADLAAEPATVDSEVTTKAAESLIERIEIHDFAAQAAVRTSANRFFGDSPDTSFDFTELGLNASLRATPRLLFAGQVLLRRAGDMSDGSPSLDYLLAAIGRAIIDENVEWAFLGFDFDGELRADRPLATASFWYQDASERLKLGLSTLVVDLEFDAGPASPIGAGEITAYYNIASVEYNTRDWSLTSELMLMPLPGKQFGR